MVKIAQVFAVNEMSRLPNFFVVGAPKCGTSSMHIYLEQHPDIFMPKIKEPHFFSTDLTPPRSVRDLDIYRLLFAKAKDELMVGESSASYLYSKVAASNIKAFCPTAKIIVMLRNPVDMMYSLHSQAFFSGLEDLDFVDALDAEGARTELPGAPEKVFRRYRPAARFSSQVQRYFARFGRENVHVIVLDDLSREPRQVYEGVLKFLNVRLGFLPDFGVVNPNKRPRSRRFQKLILDAEPMKGKKAPIRSLGLRVLKRLNTKQGPRKRMDPLVRQQLVSEFVREIDQLGELLGRDLSHWANP